MDSLARAEFWGRFSSSSCFLPSFLLVLGLNPGPPAPCHRATPNEHKASPGLGGRFP